MKIISLKLETISPVQYFYIQASGGMRTSPFIGDIALKYSMLNQMGLGDPQFVGKTKPDYSELNKWEFWFTVAVKKTDDEKSLLSPIYMKSMLRNTMQGIDYNGTNMYPSYKVGSAMYKNFFFVQPLKPGNEFSCYLISNDENITVPSTPRVGNNKTGMLKVEKATKSTVKAVINAYTIINIMKKKVPTNRQFEFSEHVILQYFLLGYFEEDELLRMYE